MLSALNTLINGAKDDREATKIHEDHDIGSSS
jgi:hypothetical protein